MSLRCRLQGARAPMLGAIATACIVSSCSGGEGRLACEEPGEYLTSRSAPPLRVPEGLTVPDETDALRVPPAGNVRGSEPERADEEGTCLERPPDYFEGGEADDPA